MARFSEQFGTPRHSSFQDFLSDPGIDAVYVATPHPQHAPHAIATLESGKHVLVEKPMGTSVEECAAMADAARRAGKVLVVGPSHGFDEPVRQCATMIETGEYGPVRQITAINYTDYMYRPRQPEELETSRGGGVVYSQAAHHIDVIRRLAGQPVLSVRAMAGNWDRARPSEGAYSAFLTFEGGAVATLTYSGYAHYDSDELMGWISELGWPKQGSRHSEARNVLARLSPEEERQAKIARSYGRDSEPTQSAPHHEHFGFVLVSCERADLRLHPNGIEIHHNNGREFRPIAPPQISRAAVIDEFVDAITVGKKPIHDAAWGLETMACCSAILRSSAEGAEIKMQSYRKMTAHEGNDQ